MGCPEMIEEWMNLYVDHALEPEEEKLLQQHIQTCSDCAEKFTLLKELSARLEQLPMATPSYDLVDAILPQLQIIDQARKEEASTMAPVPMVRDRASSTSKRNRIFKNGLLGTVVAAAIFGFFVYNHDSNNMRDADGSVEPVGVVENNNNASSNAQTPSNQQTTDDTHNNNEISLKASQNDQLTDQKPVESQPKAEQKVVTEDKENQAETHKDQSNKSASSNTDRTDRNSTKNSSDDRAKKHNKDVQSPSKSPEAPRTFVVKDQSNQDQGEVKRESSDQQGNNEFFNGDMPIGKGMLSSSLSQWISPDGSYSIELNDAHLYLYRLSTEANKTLLLEQDIEGAWLDGVWSQEKLTFSYRTEVDGNTKSFDIDPKAFLEKNK